MMQKDGVVPDVITYTSLIKACANSNSPNAVTLAEETFSAMQQRTNHFSSYVEPTELTFQRLLQTHMRVRPPVSVDTRRVWELFDDMKCRGISPSISTYRYCVRAALIDLNVPKALSIVETIKNSTKSKYDFKSWLSVANACKLHGYDDCEMELRKDIALKRSQMEINTLTAERLAHQDVK
jgi:hypothetical protein